MAASIFFAGGGTGGHIYPALAIARQIKDLQPEAKITFFCSDRAIDAQILANTGFRYIPLPAVGFSANPLQIAKFLGATYKSYLLAKKELMAHTPAVVVGVGGFVSTGPILAAHKLGICVKMVNTDSVPGKANKLLSRYADEIYVQFEMSKKYFGSSAYRVVVTGCPLRAEFANLDRNIARKRLFSGGLEPVSESFEVVSSSLKIVPSGLTTASSSLKRVLLITGASSGARSINETICVLLEKLSAFSDSWEIIHLTGKADFESVKSRYKNCKITHKVLDYYDGMADLLSAADLVIGRAGAVSVAEYAAAGVPCIVMPYPYHKDNHQRKNAEQLEKAGCAIIVDDRIDAQKNAAALWPILEELLTIEKPNGLTSNIQRSTSNFEGKIEDAARTNPKSKIQNLKLEEMREKARQFGRLNAAAEIAKKILNHREHSAAWPQPNPKF